MEEPLFCVLVRILVLGGPAARQTVGARLGRREWALPRQIRWLCLHVLSEVMRELALVSKGTRVLDVVGAQLRHFRLFPALLNICVNHAFLHTIDR